MTDAVEPSEGNPGLIIVSSAGLVLLTLYLMAAKYSTKMEGIRLYQVFNSLFIFRVF